MWAALYHHFNDHSKCSKDWCQWRPAGKKDPAENTKGVKRSSDNNKWKTCYEVFETYLTDAYLKQTYHGFDSQKNESLNLKVATVAPKHKCFSKTKSLMDRIALVVILDSIGADAGISRIIAKIRGRQRAALPPNTHAFLFAADKEAKRKKAYNAKPETKAHRAKKIQKQIKRKILEDKSAQKKGLYYYSGVVVAPETAEKKKKKKKKTADGGKGGAVRSKNNTGAKNTGPPPICKWCGREGHVRRTHKNCGQKLARPKKPNEASNKKKSDENPKTSDETSDANEGEPLSLVI
jgi:hypothetical protein